MAIYTGVELFRYLTQKQDKTVFISYNHVDARYKHMLVAWAKNEKTPFSFDDSSTDFSVNSKDIGVVRRVVSSRIRQADLLLCLIGERTHKSEWVDWEIEKAKEKGLPLVAVKLSRSNKAPKSILNSSAIWAHSYTYKNVISAIKLANGSLS